MLYMETLKGHSTRRQLGQLRTDLGTRTRTHDDGEPLQEAASAIEQLTRRTFPVRHENHVRGVSGNAFGNGTRDRGVKRPLRLGSKRTFNEALTKTRGLEIKKNWQSGLPSGCGK
jgi:hypothetical protein